MCQAEPGDPQERATFVKNTRKLFLPCLVYSVATHLSWQMEENHESMSTYSRCFLQATRKDLRSLAELEVDPVAQIVTVIIDVITDKGATHFVKAGSGSVDESKDDEDEDDEDKDDEDKDDDVGDEDKDKDVSALLHSLHNSHSLHSTHSLHSLHSRHGTHSTHSTH
jgi:Ran GTPase-activating protein (RanGAP) involved in mRNA processing and transport